MSYALIAAAIVAALATLIGGLTAGGAPTTSRRAATVGLGLGWLVIFGGAILAYLGELGTLGSIAALVSVAGVAVLPAGGASAAVRRGALVQGSFLPLSLAVAAVFVAEAPVDAGRGVLVYASHAALVAAAVNAGIASAALTRWRKGGVVPLGPAVVVGGLLLSVGVAGVVRAGAGVAGWALPLSAGGADVVWQAEALVGVSFAAAMPVEGALVLVSAGVGLALVVLTATATLDASGRRSGLVAAGWGLLGAVPLAMIGLIGAARNQPGLPDADGFVNAALDVLSAQGLERPEALQGSFSVAAADVEVALHSVLFDDVLLAVAALIAGAMALRVWRLGGGPGQAAREAESAGPVPTLYGRDLMLRTVVLGWLSWLVGLLVHWSFFGVPGRGTPAEFVATGALLVATAIALVGWRGRGRAASRWAAELAAGAIVSILLLVIAIAYGFDAPFGLSLTF